MGLIQDESGRPAETTAADAPVNGTENPSMGKLDVRRLETGTLIYNLIRATNEEVGIGNALQAMELHKAAQKLVVDPPEMQRAKQVYSVFCQRRYVFAHELNLRFAHVDALRAAEVDDAERSAASAAETPASED